MRSATLAFERERMAEARTITRRYTTIPLAEAALCLDCEALFWMSNESCPACGSRAHATPGRFLDGGAA
jgi:hypothetical protein